MDLSHLPNSDKGNFKDATTDEHRFFLASLVHYFSLIALVHKTRDNEKSGLETLVLLEETLEQSRKDVLKFYFSGNIVRGMVGEDHLITFKLDRLQGQIYKEKVQQWQTILTDAIRDYDLFGDADSLKCGLTIPLELLKIVGKKEETPMIGMDLSDPVINMYVDKVYLKLKMNQRRKGSFIFS